MPRRELDFYETPPHYIAALLEEIDVRGQVYEPCVGEGAIAHALRQEPWVRVVTTNDIDTERDADGWCDARLQAAWTGRFFDWAITNPPFSDELEILQLAIEFVPNVAFLARISFMEPTQEREWFLEQHPPHQRITLPRYSFRPNDKGKRATDSVTCEWLIWHADKQPRQNTVWSNGKAQTAALLRGLA